mgnify:CR=1 FL=1
MPNVSSFGAQTDNAIVSGTVTDRQMVIPDIPPQGLMSVGPRVTPNFITEPWNKLNSYNFFDVVKDGAGASYIAIKPVVPTNTELTDEEFWFKWSDPNAQLNELEEVVKLYDGRISQNASAITEEVARAKAAEQAEEQRATAAEATKAPNNHASEDTTYGIGNTVNYGHVKLAEDTHSTSGANDGIAATPNMVHMLTEDVRAKLDAKIATKADRAEFAGKKLVTIGDSIMYGTGTSDPATQSIHAQIAAMLDMTVYNYSENNAGFTTNGSGSRKANYLAQLTAAHAEHPDADVIVISGGCNDATVDTDVYTAAVTAFRYAHDNFPNAKVFAAPFQYGACQGNDTIANGNSGRNVKVINNISRAALATNTCLINHCWEMMVGQSQLLSDAIHPNAEGAKIQAAKIVMGMFGYDYRPTYYDLPTPGSNVNRNEFTAYCIDGIVTVQGTCKTTASIGAFKSLMKLPDYANRGTSRVLGGMIGGSWSYVGVYHTGKNLTTPVAIDANSDVYIGQETYPLGM